MKAAGIIAEYNPLHKGHLYHIQECRRILQPDVLIILISSYFSQRALPSLLSVQDKTRLALAAGADLVIELPSVYASQSADQFAMYSIEALKTAGVSAIFFGSESADLSKLRRYAKDLETIEHDPSTSLARNLEKHLHGLGSNDILGVQYVRWCDHFGIEPVCMLRDQSMKSATLTRQEFFDGKPQFLDSFFSKNQRWDTYYPYLQLYLLMSAPEVLNQYFLCTEGIENRLIRLAKEKKTWNDFLEAAITKTYTKARIQRTCLFLILQITKEQMKRNDSYFAVRVLGAKKQGLKWLGTLPKGTPVWTRFKDMPEFIQEVQIKTAALYHYAEPDDDPFRIVVPDEKELFRLQKELFE